MPKSDKRRSRLSELAKRSPLVAGAVAVGLGAGTGEADADLVIQNINQELSNAGLNFDLDQDGTDDFRVADNMSKATISTLGKGTLFNDGVKGSTFALIFAAGERVDGSSGVPKNFVTLFDGSQGPFATTGATGFVGLTLQGGGNNDHYGWVEITRGSTIVGRVGYQTTAGAPAVAGVPEPSSLALIAMGAAGFGLLRRRRKRIEA